MDNSCIMTFFWYDLSFLSRDFDETDENANGVKMMVNRMKGDVQLF
jgi:hypothetical protein